MAKHRLLDAKRSGKLYKRIGPTGQLIHTWSIWLTPKSQLVEPWVIYHPSGNPYYTIDSTPVLRSRNTYE